MSSFTCYGSGEMIGRTIALSTLMEPTPMESVVEISIIPIVILHIIKYKA